MSLSGNEPFMSIETSTDISIKENSDSEEAKWIEKAPKSKKYSLDHNLLCRKLQALELSYKLKAENWKDSYDGSVSSEDMHSCESQKSLVGSDVEVGHGNKFLKTQKRSSNENRSMEQNSILEAKLESRNESKVNLLPEYKEANLLRLANEYELTKSGLHRSKSVSTDDLNYLLSVAYCQNNQLGSRSTVSSYTYSSGISSCNSPNGSQNVSSYPSYEEINGFDINSKEGKEIIEKHMIINEQIIDQVTELLDFAKNRPRFLGSYTHLDAEKILLVAKTRFEVLWSHLCKATEPLDKETSATIVLEKFDVQLVQSNNAPNVEEYYMCILEHQTTVYSTDVKMANEYGCISFGGRFIFENMLRTFCITVRLYSMTIKRSTTICGSLMKRPPQGPMMTLIGLRNIVFHTAKDQIFRIRNVDDITAPEHKLLTDIGLILTWPKTIKGFLTIGFSRSDRQPKWNKRWSVLENAQLKYFNFPSDEIFCSPIGVINIRECVSFESSSFEYMMRRTFMLVFNTNQNGLVKLYISADSREEQELWYQKFKAIIRLRNNWNGFKNEMKDIAKPTL